MRSRPVSVTSIQERELKVSRWWLSWCSNGAFEYHGPWWITGYELGPPGRRTICAAVLAGTEDDARRAVTIAHDDPDVELLWRFVEPRVADGEPFCERFPQAAWMCWPDVAEVIA